MQVIRGMLGNTDHAVNEMRRNVFCHHVTHAVGEIAGMIGVHHGWRACEESTERAVQKRGCVVRVEYVDPPLPEITRDFPECGSFESHMEHVDWDPLRNELFAEGAQLPQTQHGNVESPWVNGARQRHDDLLESAQGQVVGKLHEAEALVFRAISTV